MVCYDLVEARREYFCILLFSLQEIFDKRSTSAAFNSYFLNNFFGKGIRWISMKRLFNFFKKIIVIKILLVFDVRSFLTKLYQFASSFFTRMFFWSKIIFDENFDDMNNFFQKLHKSRFL